MFMIVMIMINIYDLKYKKAKLYLAIDDDSLDFGSQKSLISI
ncbi:hypothetical protein [Caldicellulosiruptor changbaiensis]|nr:hypothetical protein [Caldicellulosiruptor changbaiensis]